MIQRRKFLCTLSFLCFAFYGMMYADCNTMLVVGVGLFSSRAEYLANAGAAVMGTSGQR
jgi:hypothetical protein